MIGKRREMVIKKEGMAWLGKVVSIYLIEGADRIQ